jgi:hypothetical protein
MHGIISIVCWGLLCALGYDLFWRRFHGLLRGRYIVQKLDEIFCSLFIHSSSGAYPSPTLWSSGSPPSLLNVFFLLATCLLFRLFFPLFSLGGGHSVQGAMLVYHVPLSSPVGLCLPKQSGSWHLAVRELSWFLCLMWSGDAMCGLGVWRIRVLPFLGGFSCQVYLQHLSKILL